MGKEILAKSNGVTLYEHSIIVSKFAVQIAKNCLNNDFMSFGDKFLEEKLIESARIGGLLHDIGKCTKEFQKRLVKDLNADDTTIESKLPYRHNEVGWAFLVRNLKLPSEILTLVLDSVYWHHGISNQMNDYSDIHININDEDIKKMMEFLGLVLPEGKVDGYAGKTRKAPKYYVDDEDHEDINAFRTFVRTCVISADRLASKHSETLSDEDIEEIVSAINNASSNFQTTTHKYNGTERFQNQNSIAVQALVGGTVQINAPAGFGKTLLGLMATSPRKRKLIWVCPRNIVAESVYESIMSEIANTTDNKDLSVELYLANEVKKANSKTEGFESDIIVTNIDNFLSPSVDNRNADKLYSIINCDVIFDEYHELITESAMFACFINIMRVRHTITNSYSILMSATPVDISRFLGGEEIYVLPSNNSHYPAAHTKKYLFRTLNDFVSPTENNNLFIFNSIKNAQTNKNFLKGDILIHSDFTDEDRAALTSKLYQFYGKDSDRQINKPNVVGTHVIQASLDISFNHLYESVLSPQSTLQRIGRCDRWGDCPVESSINVVNYANTSETSIRNVLYTNNLANIWFEYLTKYDNQKLTLDELYQIYNNFEIENKTIIDNFLNIKYQNSLSQLTNIYPIKMFHKKTKSDVITSGGNKLRVTGGGLFVILKHHNSTNYTEPFNVNIYRSIEDDFNENDNTLRNLKNTMKSLRDIDDQRFDYNEILEMYKHMEKNKKLNGWIPYVRNQARKSNTPYIRFDKVYHPEYGCISSNLLETI